jgi:glucosylceramidase
MSDQTSRREFLGISALGLAAAVTPVAASEQAPATSGPGNGSEIGIWVTSGEDRFKPAAPARWGPATETSSGDQILLDPTKKFQEILGFGGAFTDAACYTVNRLDPQVREELFHEMFHPSEMGLNVCRTCIGSSDYTTTIYSFDDGTEDPELGRFSIEHDRKYILPILREARQANPDLFLFSAPWSPPGWMKFNGTMLGGSMRKFYLPYYAQYLLKFLQGYAAEGVPVQAITSQNEVDTDQDGRMPACIWAQEHEIEFVSVHLGPLLKQSGVPTQIWFLDHNYNLWGRVADQLGDDKFRAYADGIAWHGYAGTPDMMSKVHELYPDTPMYWTEGGPRITDTNYLMDWCKWGGTFSVILRNWCRSITAWNLALNELGQPNMGPASCAGVVTVHSQTKEITRSGMFWALAHYSRMIRRGAHRFDSQSEAAGLDHTAAENPGGQQVLVITNTGPARTIELRLASMAAQVSLPENSVATLAWE